MTEEDFDIILVDGMNTLWRSAHAMKALGFEDQNGFVETGAVYGFLDQVISVVNRSKTADVLIAWEGSREGRREVDPDYKSHRDEPDERMLEMFESVYNQRDILRALLGYTSWGQITAPGWEADDAIATAAAAAHRVGLSVLILSNDTDLFQCLRDEPRIYQWKTGARINNPVWTPARLLEEKGVPPERWAAVKALGGDSSDGYKGVKGIGEKWACKFLAEHQGFDDVVSAALAVASDKGESPVITQKKAESIRDSREYAEQCFELARVRESVRTITHWGEPDKMKLLESMRGLKFHSLCSNKTLRRLT